MTQPLTKGPSTALVFAAGDAPPDLAAHVQASGVEHVVCADGGLTHCLDAGFSPSCLIGDFDSIDKAVLSRPDIADTPRLQHPVDKDASDLELCLEYLLQREPLPDQVILLGVSGGRSDHHLFNWLLPALRDWPFRLRLVDKHVDAHLVTPSGPCDIECAAGDIVSLLPLGRAEGVTTDRLRFALSDAVLSPGSTLGLSNEASGGRVQVSVTRGRVLAMRVLS